MAERVHNEYTPDYLVTPGEVLEEYIEVCGMTQAELAIRTGLAKKTINEIIKGKSPITPETALKLERPLGRPAHFWNNLERQFQEDRTRLAEKDRLRSCLDWLKNVPVHSMIRVGWIAKKTDDVSQLDEVLRFFGVASPEQWERLWRTHQTSHRQGQKLETSTESISAWLRKGEIEARDIACASFDKKRFQEVLQDIRGLATEAPEVFLPRLVQLCSSAGVAVVFVPELPKTGVHGSTRWLGEKAVIQLSLRYRSNDQLWFTLFHGAGHIIRHGRKEIFIEGASLHDEKELEADAFARDKLIPSASLRRFLAKWNRSHFQIESFAGEIGIAPGIVVGRLQHDRVIPKSHGNQLKVFYRWSNRGLK